MSLQEVSRPYETLIRHHVDGSISSHHVRITEIYRDDGNVISAMVDDPIPLSMAGGDLNFDAIIGTDCALALRANEVLAMKLQQAEQQISLLEQDNCDANAKLEAMSQQVAALEQEKDDLVVRLASAHQQNDELQAQVKLFLGGVQSVENN